MFLPNTGVNRPVLTSMIFAGLLLFGTVAYFLLPKDMLPEIEIPTLTVVTLYPGASALEVESQVTQTLEEVLAGVNNLKSISSRSKENVSFITLEFDWNTNLDAASGSVRDFLEFSRRSLPSEASAPMVMRISSDMFPVLIYGVTTRDKHNKLSEILDEQVTNALKRAPGVGALVILGKPEQEVVVTPNPLAMQAYKVNIALIAQALQTSNTAIPSGTIISGRDELAVTVPARFTHVDEISETVLTAWQGKVVKIKDVATVEIRMKESKEIVKVSGEPAVGIFVQKQAGANILEVVEAVRSEVNQLQKELPEGVIITELMDNSEMVTATLNNLFTTISYAALFVILVVLFFLSRWRSSLVILLTIPFSLIVAFLFMYIAGFTVNIFSLMSLAIAIGMVIDNAIVVLENITKKVEEGLPAVQAALFGTREMAPAITASTLTTIAVFLPLVFMGGVVGIMFRQLAVITAITLLASLFTAVMFTPMLASRLLTSENKNQPNRFVRWSEKIFLHLEELYTRSLTWSLKHGIAVLILAASVFGITIWAALNTGTDYIPEFDAGDLSAVVETRIGSSTSETLKITQQIEEIFREEIPEIRNLYSLTGQSDQGLLSSVGFSEGKNITTVFARTLLPEDRERTSKEMADRLRERILRIPGVENATISGGSLISAAVLGNVSPIQVRITGVNLGEMNQVAQHLADTLKSLPGFINIENTVDNGKPELQMHVDKNKAAIMGLNAAMISLQVRQSIYGQQAGELDMANNRSLPVNIRYPEELRTDKQSVENILVTTLLGNQVKVGDLVDVKTGTGPLEVQRENQQRVVYVSADLAGMALGDAAQKVSEILEEMDIPAGIRTGLSGQVSEQKESFGNLYAMLIIGLILVFMVMASQFESLKHPFVILFTIPFSLTGVIAAFLLTGLNLSVVTFLGVIMLLGIVVNNGIVLVDYTNLLRRRGEKMADAITLAGRSRLRPVLMTTFTTLLGMLPMTLSRGIGSEIWSPLAITVIGGLLVSTLVTLILIPVVYRLFEK
jgi:HAE1 family hydrophobic/amphiphilic exporter-1